MYLHYIRYISNDIYIIFLVLHPSEINVLKMLKYNTLISDYLEHTVFLIIKK
jgi:hypothetical protein